MDFSFDNPFFHKLNHSVSKISSLVKAETDGENYQPRLLMPHGTIALLETGIVDYALPGCDCAATVYGCCLVFANGQIVDQRILFRRLLFILIHKIFPGIKAEICIKDLESKLPLG